MTVQAQEILKYRDETYRLLGAPLNPFLEKNKDIQFEDYSTANWRGYQGYWLLKENKLYLTELECANYTMKEIFNIEEPVLANWYNGTLEFGVGTHHRDHWWGYYDNYIWLNIENGIVIEKKVIKRFYQEPSIEFGKYKGRKLIDIINGKIYRNVYTTIKEFIQALMNFICDKEYDYKVQCPHIIVEKEDVELVKEIRNYGVEYFLTQNYIAFSSKKFWENSNEDEKAEKLSNLVERILTSDFTKTLTLTKKGLEKADIVEQSILINPDIQYIEWAIKECRILFFTS